VPVTYSLAEMVEFAQQAGFQGESAKTIAAIAMAESSGNPYAVNPADPGGSYGLTQINGAAHGIGYASQTIGNPLEAFKQAFSISKGGTTFQPWSTYTNGMYLPYAQQLGIGGAGSSSASTGTTSSGSGGSSGSLSGTSATGQAIQSQSPLSAIFASIGNIFQSAGLLMLGIVLVAVGAWYVAKPRE